MRVALVGAGGMAGRHARCYSAIDGATLAGVMDVEQARAAALAQEHGAKAYTDLDAMLAELRPDIVDVCTPTCFHADYVCRAAAAKPRGISTEKPMALTVADCERMNAACAENGVPLFVAQVLRWFPEFATARRQVLDGAVGKPAAIRTRRGGPYPHGWRDWFGRPSWSGGVILDLMIHDLDWLRWTFGPVERVYCKSLAARPGAPEQVDRDYALATLRFASGAIAHVEGTWADPGGFKVAFEIAGDAGLLEYNFNQPAGAPYSAATVAAAGLREGVVVPESPLAEDPYQLELQHFVDCVRDGRPAEVTGADGMEAVRIGAAAIESARTGLPVRLV